MLKTLTIALSLMVGASLAADDSEFEREFNALKWHTAGTYSLPFSHSSLKVPKDHLLLVGEDARKLSRLYGNSEDSSLEAVVLDVEYNNSVFFVSDVDGYVSINDWGDVDADQLLADFRENTEALNKERVENGFDPVYVVGWIQKPTLDKSTSTVYWSFESKMGDSEENYFNSIALRLGRHGYEKLVWVGDMSQYKASGGELDTMMKAHAFDPGHTYSDFVSTDKLAGYGIASLVAATAGAKALKAGFFGILFKKIGALIVAGVGYLFYRVKNFFKKKRLESDS